jgi:hypothetical protein
LLLKWIKDDKIVPPPQSDNDINRLYIIVPPLQTQILFFNNDSDPTGNGVQGFHSEDHIIPPPPPHFYWTIVKTGDALDGSFKGDLSNAEAWTSLVLLPEFLMAVSSRRLRVAGVYRVP